MTEQTEMIGADRQLEVVLGVLQLGVLQVQDHSGVVDEHRQLLTTGTKSVDERSYRLQVRKVELHRSKNARWSKVWHVLLRNKLEVQFARKRF